MPILWTGEYGLLRTGTDFYGLWAYGVVGAMGFGNSGAHGSLEAFFFCTLCFCVIPGRPDHSVSCAPVFIVLFVLFLAPPLCVAQYISCSGL